MAHNNTIQYKLVPAAVALALGGTLPAAAYAQATGALQEVVVTAEKREEFSQNIPISLVALNASNLEARGITDLRDLPSSAPNLQMSQAVNSASSVRIFMRGVGNFDDQITQDPSVAVYVDGVYVARSQGLATEVADIERIEILRGPQGSLYGRNATGGAINFITKEPQLNQWGFSQTFTFGSYDEFRSRTLANVPLGDRAAARLSFVRAKKDGFVKNEGTGVDTFGEKDRKAWRIDLRWVPLDDVDLRYTYDQSQIDDTSPYLVKSPINGDVPRPTKGNALVSDFQPNDVTPKGHQLTVSWDAIDNLTVKSITAYRELDNYDYQDYLTGQLGAFTPLTTADDLHQKQWSQEFQLVGNTSDEMIQYVAGVYYFRETGDGDVYTGVPTSALTTVASQDITNTAKALYGQATITPGWFDERLHFTLGTRWSKDRREAELVKSTVLNSGTVIPGGSGKGDKEFSNWSPSVTVSYDITDDANAYLKWVRGYKTGGFNIRASSIAAFERGFGPETLTSVEGGIKSQWLENRLRFNAAVFRAGYDDIQLNAQSDPNNASVSDVLNAGKATISGAELELTALLTDDLTVGLNYGYLDAAYDRIINAAGADVTTGYVFVNAPHNMYTVNADYNIAATPIGKLSANVNYSWQSEKFATASTSIDKLVIDSYGLLNARLTLDEIPGLPAGMLKVSVWGKNLTDEDYSVLHAPLFGGYRMFGDPRSVGIDVAYNY